MTGPLSTSPFWFTRRDFLRGAGASLAAMALWLAGCSPETTEAFLTLLEKIANRPVRREVSSLAWDDPILVSYRTAIAAMKALDSANPLNWNNIADIHRYNCPHGNWLFLPWHRAYLYYFERICRHLSGNADFALPYWNWQDNPALPAAFADPTLPDGQPNPLYLPGRSLSPPPDVPSSVRSGTVMESILRESNFEIFGSQRLPSGSTNQRSQVGSGPLEATPHNSIHGWVGGDMRLVAFSPRDPIFWLHHNMVECVWVEWELGRRFDNPDSPEWRDWVFDEFVDETGSSVTVTPAEMALYPLIAYRYERTSKGADLAASAFDLETEAGAEDAQAHLQEGGETSVELIDVVEPAVDVRALEVAVDGPALVEFALTVGDLVNEYRQSGANRLMISISVQPPEVTNQSLLLWVNQPEPQVDARGAEGDPRFVGALSTFGRGLDDTFLCDLEPSPVRFALNVAGLLIALSNSEPDEQLIFTMGIAPAVEDISSVAPLTIDILELQFLQVVDPDRG